MSEVEKRGYSWRGRRAKYLGEKFGMLTCVKHVGFLGKFSVYLFKCDCGGEVERRAAHVKCYKGLQHCGCQSKYERHGASGTSEHLLWMNTRRRGVLCPEWHKSFSKFSAECLEKRNARFLSAIDPSQPIGPGNFIWRDHLPKFYDNQERAVEAMVKLGRSRKQAIKDSKTLSRQRLLQLIHKANGVCQQCSDPVEPGFKVWCRRCRLNSNEWERYTTRRKAKAMG